MYNNNRLISKEEIEDISNDDIKLQLFCEERSREIMLILFDDKDISVEDWIIRQEGVELFLRELILEWIDF